MAKKYSRGTIGRLWDGLRQSPTQSARWFDLAHCYSHYRLPWQAGYAARQAVRFDPALGPTLQTLERGSWQDPTTGDAQLGRPTLPEADALARHFASWLKQCPSDWLTWLYLARLQEMLTPSDTPPNPDTLQQAIKREFVPGESLHWMGVWRIHAGDPQGAVTALSALLAIRPVRFGSMMYLGEALLRIGHLAGAEKAFARASHSSNPDFLLSLASRVYAHNYWQEAIDILKKALDLRPTHIPVLLALAKIQSEVYLLADCDATLRRIEALEPNHAEARLLDAARHGRMGDAKSHLALLQRAYQSDGDPLSRLASSIAMTALYQDTLSPTEMADLHVQLCAPIEAAIRPKTDFINPRTHNRRLRVGYVTGDLHRQHPVNIFMLPVLLHFDRTRFKIHIYYTGSMHDEYTRQAKANVDGWVEAVGLDDVTLQQMIVADQIDILIDLAGHTASHRLGVFAMRAAPVQATFLGYPHSTGLSTIDWLIGDPIVTPVEQAHLFSEGLAQLPHSVFCWAPVDSYPLPPPRPESAPVIFGSFNNVMKLSPQTIRLWAKVLHAVPDSLLLLKAPALRDDAVQARFLRLWAEQGILAHRLIMRGPSELSAMMQAYGDLDIALDPTPYNGGTTTLQALWMGVPVVTLAGGHFASRMGASFMQSLGEVDWIANDTDSYVAAAVALARNRTVLRGQRPHMRARMAASPLCDIKRYTSDFESLLNRMWVTYCAADGQRLLQMESTRTDTQAEPVPSIPHPPEPASNPPSSLTQSATMERASLEISTSRQMLSWMTEQNLSIVLTTHQTGHQTGKLFLLGVKPDGTLSVFERTFNQCMALCPTRNGFYLSSLYQIWRFENLLTPGDQHEGYDGLYVPQIGYTTGELGIQDMAVDGDHRLMFVNTRFSSLSTLSNTHSFRTVWHPPFISQLVAEDRCHLNGLAMKDGRAAYVTAISRSDVAEGWRAHRVGGGLVLDVAHNEIVAHGLSMPNAPRWYQDKLWMLNAGTGELGHIELETGRFVPITFCAGYLRGLSFHGHFALVTLSLPRHDRPFSDLPLGRELTSRHATPRCGIQVIDLRTGDAVHWLRMEGMLQALYSIITLPHVRRPMALGFLTNEIEHTISIER